MRELSREFTLRYDPDADAAYLSLVPSIGAGQVARTLLVDNGAEQWTVNIDVDAEGRILGLEVLGASRYLPRDLLS